MTYSVMNGVNSLLLSIKHFIPVTEVATTKLNAMKCKITNLLKMQKRHFDLDLSHNQALCRLQ